MVTDVHPVPADDKLVVPCPTPESDSINELVAGVTAEGMDPCRVIVASYATLVDIGSFED